MFKPEDQDEPGEGSVGGYSAQPVVVQVEENHLRLGRFQDQVSKLLNLEASLEGKLKLGPLDHNVGEVKEMNLQRIQHPFPCHNDLFGLLLYRERPG